LLTLGKRLVAWCQPRHHTTRMDFAAKPRPTKRRGGICAMTQGDEPLACVAGASAAPSAMAASPGPAPMPPPAPGQLMGPTDRKYANILRAMGMDASVVLEVKWIAHRPAAAFVRVWPRRRCKGPETALWLGMADYVALWLPLYCRRTRCSCCWKKPPAGPQKFTCPARAHSQRCWATATECKDSSY